MKKMTYNQKLETSREVRQWIKGIFIPAIGIGVIIDATNPNLKYEVKNWIEDKKNKVKDRFSKKEES